MTDPSLEAAVAGLLSFYRDLSPATVPQLRALARPDMRFRDPFNDLVGIDPVLVLFAKMFEDLDSIAWDVTGWALDGHKLYLAWHFRAEIRGRGMRLDFPGMSEVLFDANGLVASHVDHWDAGRYFYEQLPLLGRLLRWLRRRIGMTTA